MSDEPLKLQWRRTWPEKGADFVALDPENCFSVPVCRVLECRGIYPHRIPWEWTACHSARADIRVFDLMGEKSGFAQTKAEAARLAEAAHFRFIAAIDTLGFRDRLAWYHRTHVQQKAIWTRRMPCENPRS